ncbi:MAG: hypothetical protein HY847_10995 [Betaproteobacteria bacterium]|nr:hypothetical protein [Betaproteobacteria bacterium]
MRTLNFSKQLGVTGFLSRFFDAVEPSSRLRPNIVVHAGKLQASLLFAKFLEDGHMEHWFFARHPKTPNVKFSGGAPLHGAASAGTQG